MNVYYVAGIPYSDELYHHGIKGQKWGVRRTPEQLGYDVGNRIQSAINRVTRPFQKGYEKKEEIKKKVQSKEFRAKVKKNSKNWIRFSCCWLTNIWGSKN